MHTVIQEDKARIRLIADAMGKRASEPEILSALIDSGVPRDAAVEFYQLVAHGLRAGVSAGVTDGLSAQQHRRGESALWDAAFEEGQRQFGGAVRSIWLRRFAWILVPIIVLVIWLISK